MTDVQAPRQYTAEEIVAARELVDFDNAQKAAELAARRAAYLAAVQALVAAPEWAKVRDGLLAITTSIEADGLLSFQVAPLGEIMARLDKLVPAPQPAA